MAYSYEAYPEFQTRSPTRSRHRKQRSVSEPVRRNDYAKQYPLEEESGFRQLLLLPLVAFLILCLFPSVVPDGAAYCRIHDSVNSSPIEAGLIPTSYQAVFANESAFGIPSDEGFASLVLLTRSHNPGNVWDHPIEVQPVKGKIPDALYLPKELLPAVSKIKPVRDSKPLADAVTTVAGISTSLYHRTLLKKVVAAAEPVRKWATTANQDIFAAHQEIKRALRYIQLGYGAISVEMKNLKAAEISQVSDNRLARVLSTLSTDAKDRLEKLQKQYVAILFRDYQLSTLDAILQDRSNLLQSLALNISKFDASESMAAEGFETLHYRANAMLENAQNLLDQVDEDSYRKARCAWTQAHMPLDKVCTCDEKTWRKFFMPGLAFWKADREQLVRKRLNAAFWETVFGGAKVSDGKVWSDIRDDPSCVARVNATKEEVRRAGLVK